MCRELVWVLVGGCGVGVGAMEFMESNVSMDYMDSMASMELHRLGGRQDLFESQRFVPAVGRYINTT